MTATALTLVQSTPSYSQASVEFIEDDAAAVLYMHPTPRPCFTHELLQDINTFQQDVIHRVKADIKSCGHSNLRYTVLASGIKGTYNLGGDLNLFAELIEKRDREALYNYAKACIDDAYGFSSNLHLPLTSIALIEGNAQGGGFEAALSCSVIIAEKGTYMGFPEVLFNLFPGMGAYSYLSRRTSPAIAERLIFSGDLYKAETLYEMGVIDILAEPGNGQAELRRYIRAGSRRNNARELIRHVRKQYNHVPYDELLDITSLWVDAAMNLTETELKTMLRLVRAQNRKMTSEKKIKLSAG